MTETQIIGEICAEVKNYFAKQCDIIIGDFKISDGVIVPSVSLLDGQYFRIVGSVFNDGVHHTSDVLTDEPEFHGAVWLMRVPEEVISLAGEILDWNTKNADVISSPYQSESFGGYSYSKGGGGYYSTMNGIDWKTQAMFATRLNKYRRIRVL